MAWLLGADEAGYGPNLGPLVVSATLWHVPGEPRAANLYELLAEVVSPTATREARGRLPVADSKLLYHPGNGLAHLELGVHTALALLGKTPPSWRALWPLLCPGASEFINSLPWYKGFETPLPLDVAPADIQLHARQVGETCARVGVRLEAVQAAVVFPSQLNALIDQHGTKGAALSHTTLALVAQLLANRPETEEPVFVVCDKHGGRNKYGPLLSEFFPDVFVEIRGESTAESVYRWGVPPSRTEVVFRAKGESFLPAALASMICKYLRELAMRAENAFWQGHVPGLQATAGYPQDAKRFLAEIAPAQARLGISLNSLWRKR